MRKRRDTSPEAPASPSTFVEIIHDLTPLVVQVNLAYPGNRQKQPVPVERVDLSKNGDDILCGRSDST